MSTNPFLTRFPEEKHLWTINQQRVNGFLKFTSHTNASSIGTAAANQIKVLNDLGFFTTDSQEGVHEETDNPKYVYGEKKGQPLTNAEGSKATVYVNSERAYCDGIIRKELEEGFYDTLRRCNPNIEIIFYPYKGERVNLTKEYIKYEDGSEYKDDFTNTPEFLDESELQLDIVDKLTSPGYYEGSPLPPFPVDLDKWTYVIAIDMEYGHHALKPNGLFMCLEKALKSAMAHYGGKKSLHSIKMMNRQLRTKNRRRCSYRKRGGGFSVQSPLVAQPPAAPGSDFSFAIKQPINMPYSDCTFAQRPGQIFNQPQPDLAQTVMAGGGCGCSVPKWGGRRRSMRRRHGGRRGCATRNMRGGANGYAVDPSVSVGGLGPNVAPLHAPVPCDARAGLHQPVLTNPDPRAPADIYSLTPNQRGGNYTGNAYGPECYRATGSQLPVYNAESAGFHFRPSTEIGSTLPDGVTAYNDVVPHAARLGGARRSRKNRSRKHRSRKQ